MTIGRVYRVVLFLISPVILIILLGLSQGDNFPALTGVIFIAMIVLVTKLITRIANKKAAR